MKSVWLAILGLFTFATTPVSAAFFEPSFHITELGEHFYFDFPNGGQPAYGPPVEIIDTALPSGWTAIANAVFAEPPGEPGYNYVTANGGSITLQSGIPLPGSGPVLPSDSPAGIIVDPSGNQHQLFFSEAPASFHIVELGQGFFFDFPIGGGAGLIGPTTEDVTRNLLPGWTATVNAVFPEPFGAPGFNYITANGDTINIKSGFTLPGTGTVLPYDSPAGTIRDPSGRTYPLYFTDSFDIPTQPIPDHGASDLLFVIAMGGLLAFRRGQPVG